MTETKVTGQRGFIVPIGGAEEKLSDPTILRKFVGVAGGRDARIVVIPTASELEDTGPRYEKLFQGLDVGNVRALRFDSRADCEREDWLTELRKATGVFMTGGNQLRLSTILEMSSVLTLAVLVALSGLLNLRSHLPAEQAWSD